MKGSRTMLWQARKLLIVFIVAFVVNCDELASLIILHTIFMIGNHIPRKIWIFARYSPNYLILQTIDLFYIFLFLLSKWNIYFGLVPISSNFFEIIPSSTLLLWLEIIPLTWIAKCTNMKTTSTTTWTWAWQRPCISLYTLTIHTILFPSLEFLFSSQPDYIYIATLSNFVAM